MREPLNSFTLPIRLEELQRASTKKEKQAVIKGLK